MSRFDPFTLVDLPFRTVQNHSLDATLFIPTHFLSRSSSNHKQKCPVMVHFHGGGFILGHRRYEPWFAQWFLDLAQAQDAIIIRPDYRLLPEASMADILSDVDHFWRWVQRDLRRIAEEHPWGVLPDLSRILCCGESSGGALAVYSGLEISSILSPDGAVPDREAAIGGYEDADVAIQAVISTYAPLDPDVPELRIPRPRTIMGMRPPPPRRAEVLIRNYMQSRQQQSGDIRTWQEPTPEMWELFLCMTQQCYFSRLLKGNKDGNSHNKDMFNLVKRMVAKVTTEKLKKAEGGVTGIIPVWIIHGRDDTLVRLSFCPRVSVWMSPC